MALSDGRHRNYLWTPRSSAAFSKEDTNHPSQTLKIYAVAIGIMRILLSEIVDLVPPGGRRLD